MRFGRVFSLRFYKSPVGLHHGAGTSLGPVGRLEVSHDGDLNHPWRSAVVATRTLTEFQLEIRVSDSLTFAFDVFYTICDRLRTKTAGMPLLVEDVYSFEKCLY